MSKARRKTLSIDIELDNEPILPINDKQDFELLEEMLNDINRSFTIVDKKTGSKTTKSFLSLEEKKSRRDKASKLRKKMGQDAFLVDKDTVLEKILDIEDEKEFVSKTQFYINNNASSPIVRLIERTTNYDAAREKGELLEKVCRTYFGFKDTKGELNKKLASEADAIYVNDNKQKYLIEIKSSTINSSIFKNNNKVDFAYNSIRELFRYDFLLFQNIHFDTIKYYLLSKQDLFGDLKSKFQGQKEYKDNKIIKLITFNTVKDYAVEINTREDIDRFIQTKNIKPKSEELYEVPVKPVKEKALTKEQLNKKAINMGLDKDNNLSKTELKKWIEEKKLGKEETKEHNEWIEINRK